MTHFDAMTLLQAIPGRIAPLLMAAAVLAGCVTGRGADVGGIIGNTLHYEAVDGSFQMWIRTVRDGTYRNTVLSKRPDGTAERIELSGVWTQEGETHCRKQQQPAGGKYCESSRYFPALGHSGMSADGRLRITLLHGDVTP